MKLTLTAAGAFALMALAGAASAQDFADGKFSERSGEAIWSNVCQGCHMPQAQGAVSSGEYPALAKNPRMVSAPYVASLVLDGRKGMPAFAQMMDDEQVANIVNYVRSNFGNHGKGAITPAQVAALRAAK